MGNFAQNLNLVNRVRPPQARLGEFVVEDCCKKGVADNGSGVTMLSTWPRCLHVQL